MTESSIRSLYGKKRVRENLFFGIFYAAICLSLMSGIVLTNFNNCIFAIDI